MSTRLHIVVPDELVARIDAARGVGQPRADFIRRALELALAPAPWEEDGEAAFERIRRRAAMSADEQFEDLQRRVEQPLAPRYTARRDVRPIPKGKA